MYVESILPPLPPTNPRQGLHTDVALQGETMTYLMQRPDEYPLAVLGGKKGLYMTLWKQLRNVGRRHMLGAGIAFASVLAFACSRRLS